MLERNDITDVFFTVIRHVSPRSLARPIFTSIRSRLGANNSCFERTDPLPLRRQTLLQPNFWVISQLVPRLVKPRAGVAHVAELAIQSFEPGPTSGNFLN